MLYTGLASAAPTRIRARDWMRLVLGTFPYQVLLATAALRAMVREVREVRDDARWETVPHLRTPPRAPLLGGGGEATGR